MERVWRVFAKKQQSIGSAAFVLMSMVAASRVLGLVRDRMLSARFSPDELGVYFAAFRIPNLIFELLVMGTLTSAFIPVFTKYMMREHEGKTWRMAATLVNVTLLVLGVAMLPVLLWTRQISHVLAPGFTDLQIGRMAAFTQFMIVFQVAPLLVGNFFTGILQSFNLFLVPAIAPVVYNVGIIAGIVLFTPLAGLWAPVIGTGMGALFFMGIQIPLLFQVGWRHRWTLDFRDSGVREVGRLMLPRTIGLAVSQIDTTVDLILSTLLGARMVTIFNFAQHLQQLPIGLFGATIAQAALPSLSVASANKDREHFQQTVASSLLQILFFVLPISVLFIVLRIPVVRLVFGASRFDWAATVATGMTLSAFSVSLFAQAMIHVLARGFYAIYDSKTPVFIGAVSIFVNTALSILFVVFFHLPVWSLGISTSVASIINAGFLLVVLDKRVQGALLKLFTLPALKMTLAALVAGVVVYIPLKLLDQLVFDTTRIIGLLFLTGISGTLGMSAYLFLAWVLGVGEVHSFMRLLKKVRGPRAVLLTPVSEVVNGGVEDKLS